MKSKYEEDVLVNNHIFVWGSYWFLNQWGYKCCHTFVKNSYCTGEAGKRANQEPPTSIEQQSVPADGLQTSSNDLFDKHRPGTEKKIDKSKKKEKKKEQKKKKRNGTKDIDIQRLKSALQKEETNQNEIERFFMLNERKRPYNSMCEVKELTNEEIEAYQMKRQRDEDPMAQFLNP